MAQSTTANTNTSENSKLTARLSSRVTSGAVLAAGSGLVVGALASLAVVLPMVRTESAQNRVLSQKIVSMKPASDFNPAECIQSGGQGAGAVLGASVTLPSGGQGGGQVTPPSGGQGGGQQPFVNQLVSGSLSSSATISNTGPGSENKIVEVNKMTTTVTNHNDISVSNVNSQSATSGAATVDTNTNAGSAVSGGATNDNSTNMSINISNQ